MAKVPLGPVKPIHKRIHDNRFELGDDHISVVIRVQIVECMVVVKMFIQNNGVKAESSSE